MQTNIISIIAISFFILSVGEAGGAEFKIGLTPLVENTFPNVRNALDILARARNSPISEPKMGIDPIKAINDGFKNIDVVVGLKSQVPPRFGRFEVERGREIDSEILVVAPHGNYEVSSLGGGTFAHSDDPYVRSLVRNSFNNCVWEGANANPRKYISTSKVFEQVGDVFFVVFVYLNHSFAFDMATWRTLTEFDTDRKIVPIVAGANYKVRAKKLQDCLKKRDPRKQEYKLVSIFERSLAKTMSNRHYKIPETWYSTNWQSIEKKETIQFFIKPGKKRDFLEKFFIKFLYNEISNLERASRNNEIMRQIYEDVVGGVLLLTTGKRAIIELAKARHYWLARQQWEEKIGYWTILDELVANKSLSDGVRIQVEQIVKSLTGFIEELEAGGVQELEFEMLDASRISAFANDLLHQNAYVKLTNNSRNPNWPDKDRWTKESKNRLRMAVDYLDLHFRDFGIVSKSGEEKHKNIIKRNVIYHWKQSDHRRMRSIKNRSKHSTSR